MTDQNPFLNRRHPSTSNKPHVSFHDIMSYPVRPTGTVSAKCLHKESKLRRSIKAEWWKGSKVSWVAPTAALSLSCFAGFSHAPTITHLCPHGHPGPLSSHVCHTQRCRDSNTHTQKNTNPSLSLTHTHTHTFLGFQLHLHLGWHLSSQW